MAAELLIDGPDAAATTLLLAHGAGAGMRSPFLRDAAQAFAAQGIRCVRFEFDYMAARADGGRAGPDRMPVLQQRFLAVAQQLGPPPLLVVGGKSMGGRVATMLADRLAARACVVFGYPFHPPRRPQQLRVEHLRALRTPTMILQGERDPFGTRDEVAGYELSPAIELHWAPDGDHSLAPRKRSGQTTAGNVADAMAAAIAFLRRHAGPA